MKNIIIAACLLLAPLMAFCQDSSPTIQSFYNKYSQIEDVLDIKLSGGILKMVSSFSSDNNEKADPIEKISYLRILVMDNGNLVKPGDLKKLMRDVKSDGFEDLIQVREKETRVDVMIKEKNSIISNALLVVNDVDNFVLISLEGTFSLEDLESLDLDVEGAEYFKKMKKQSGDKKKRA